MRKGSILLSVLALLVIAGGMFAHFYFGIPAQSVQARPIGANVSVMGNNAPDGIKAVSTTDHPSFAMAPLGPSVDITRDSRYFGFLLRSKHATRRTKSEREEVSIEQTR